MARKIDMETNPTRAAVLTRWGKAMKAAREAAGFSRTQAAEMLCVERETLRAWEMGRRAAPLLYRRRAASDWGGDPVALGTLDDWCPHCGRPYEVYAASTRPKSRRRQRP